MEHDQTGELAAQLLRLTTPQALRSFRQRLSKEQAQAVISHPSVDPVDKAAIRLALAFANKPEANSWSARRGHSFDSEIFRGEQLEAEPD